MSKLLLLPRLLLLLLLQGVHGHAKLDRGAPVPAASTVPCAR
jgi:hypothetical protein